MSVYFFDTVTPAQAAGYDSARDMLVFGATGETARLVRVQFSPASATAAESITVTSNLTGKSATFGVQLAGAQPILPDDSRLIIGRPAAETLTGGAGNDGLWGGGGGDLLDGSSGNDVLGGGPGADTLQGGAGNDTFAFYAGDSGVVSGSLDRIQDWSSEDQLAFRTAGTTGNYAELTDTSFASALAAANARIATGASDYVAVQVGGDVVVFADSAGNDGGADDAVILSGRTLADIGVANFVALDGSTPAPDPRQATSGADTLVGTAGADTLDGLAGADSITGGLGDDQLRGSDGTDTLDGGAGTDTLTGDAGNDLFIFGVGQSGTTEGQLDVVAHFEPGDRLLLGGGQLAPGLVVISGPTSYAAALSLANSRIATGEVNFVLVTVGGSNGYLFVDSRNDNGQADDVVDLGSGGAYVFDSSLVTGAAPPSEPELPQPFVGSVFRDGLATITGNMDTAHLSYALNAVITIASESTVSAQVGDIRLRLDGFGFSTDGAGRLSGGTATSVAYSYGAAEGSPFAFSVTGPQISLLTLANYLNTDDAQGAFSNLLSAGNSITGGAGSDLLRGYTGDDLMNGSGGADTLWGGTGNDVIYALQPGTGGSSSATTYLRGEEGNDYIVGALGFDDANGNMGNDTISTGAGDDYCVGGKDSDLLFGDAGFDLVYGNLGNDTCSGGDGNDIVRGGQDNDVVFGGAGDDFVSGDKGSDTMTGGAGADAFHTFGDAGIDRVADFNILQGDRVQLDPGTVFTVSQVGADTVIDMTGGGQMILVGVLMSTLTPGWIFGA